MPVPTDQDRRDALAEPMLTERHRLAAAAPELLQACEELLEEADAPFRDLTTLFDLVNTRVRAAVARARG